VYMLAYIGPMCNTGSNSLIICCCKQTATDPDATNIDDGWFIQQLINDVHDSVGRP